MPESVQIFNTLSRKKEAFKPIEPGKVSLYTCGPTVYHYAHIGNLRTYVFEDLLVRVLKRAGYDVNQVMNITDVGHLVSDGDEGEDKMEKGARREGKSAWDIAKYYEDAFWKDFDDLQCLRPQKTPKATEYIQEMIEMVQTLEKKGMTYQTSDGVYYDTSKFSTYADFAKLDTENLKAGARVDVGEKKNPTDFALWKFSPAGEKRQMEWQSPWGMGFPGWHIECSAMSMKCLQKETIDIHCGGKDHIPVHHTNEIAQSEGTTGKRFVNYWMHGEFLTEKSGKMSKSADEFLTLSFLKKEGFRPTEYRFLLLQAHYRTELQFDWESLKAAKAGLDGLLNRICNWNLSIRSRSESVREEVEAYRKRFNQALYDDLNSPIAMSVLFDAVKDEALSPEERYLLISDFDTIFALGLLEAAEARSKTGFSQEIQSLIDQRDAARKNKDWAGSDRIRDELQNLGYRVEDTAQGTRVFPK